MSYIQYLIEGLKSLKEWNDDTVGEYYEKYQNKILEILNDVQNAKPNEKQKWYPMPLHRVKKIWEDYMNKGIIRDERGIDQIVDNIVDKIATLDANTALLGHKRDDPKDLIKDANEEIEPTEELLEKLGEYLQDENGQWRWSDYGLDKLVDLAGELLGETDYEKKLILIDQVLNVVHQRSDLASMFIQGGRGALNQLSGKKETE